MKRSAPVSAVSPWHGEIEVLAEHARPEGTLEIPERARGLVIFAHGSGSSRHSTRNRRVAQALQRAGLATLLFDLLTRAEEREDAVSGHLRFDIEFLARRLRAATHWAMQHERTASLRIGLFGASTGAAAALIAATDEQADVGAVVSRGGRPDLAGDFLAAVRVPTLLIVGAADEPCLPLNEEAFDRLQTVKRLEIVPHATHLFQEPGTLDIVADLAARWFAEHLPAAGWHP